METTMPETEEKPAAPEAEEKGTPAPAEKTAPAPEAQQPEVEKPKASEQEPPKKAPPPSFFVQKRKEKREAKEAEERERLSKENETLKRLLEERSQPETKTPNIFDDPDAWAKSKEKEIEERILGSLEAREHKHRLAAEAVDAEKYLLTREHLKDPSFAADVKALIDSDPKIQSVAQVSPQMAAEAAYYAICKAKGVAPHMDGLRDAAKVSAEAAKSKGASPTAPPSGGEKRWSRGEVTAYLSAVPTGSAEWKSRLAEVKQAQAEGRAP